MPLFMVDPESGSVSLQPEASFEELGVLERAHLEAWIASAPEVIGERLVIVDTEFDRFTGAKERLDILAMTTTPAGRLKLVVVELKRVGSSTTLDLQAIKYAAYCSRFTFEDVCRVHARATKTSTADARAALLEALEWPAGEEDPLVDQQPAIVLVARDFRAEVVTTVLWLIEQYGMDIACVRLTPHQLEDGRLLLSSERVLPLPEPELIGPPGQEPGASDEEPGPKISRERLRALVAAIPKGNWVSYGDLAWALGRPKAALPIGTMIATDPEIKNAHRVLHAKGTIPPGFRTADGGGPEVCVERLRADGIDVPGVDARVSQERRWPREALAKAPS